MCLLNIAKREVLRIAVRPLYLFCMIIAPVFCYLFFTTLMANGLPTDLPAGGSGQYFYHAKYYPESGCLSADTYRSTLSQCHGSPKSYPAG